MEEEKYSKQFRKIQTARLFKRYSLYGSLVIISLAILTLCIGTVNWLKNNGISDKEMLKTFNCGVGFCLITNKQNVGKITKIFSKEYQPYQIGFISKEKSKVKTFGKLQW